jgi:predicted O-linked N-acetylglucosamine transferase (SPINDLY family)
MFVTQGVDTGRLELLDASPHPELLGEYGRIDIALDTFPYSGCLTTCEALWMGVPVITCPGETLTSRQSSSCIANAGLRETIAGDLDEYVKLAVCLASDLPRLAGIRGQLREQMAASPLCDGKRFATNLLSILYDVWEQRIGHGNDS